MLPASGHHRRLRQALLQWFQRHHDRRAHSTNPVAWSSLGQPSSGGYIVHKALDIVPNDRGHGLQPYR